MPNTRFMQELSRMHYGYYLDTVESGTPPAYPHYLCLPKGQNTGSEAVTQISNSDVGTPISSSLVLFREWESRFSLQPSHAMLLSGTLHTHLPSSPSQIANSWPTDLNNTLTEFYSKFGTVTVAGEWMDKHDYNQAFDDSKEDWMLL
jgi:hypothetical protein